MRFISKCSLYLRFWIHVFVFAQGVRVHIFVVTAITEFIQIQKENTRVILG